MNTPAPVVVAIPWYKSQVLQGLLIAVVSQGILRIKQQFGIDLTIYGIDANSGAAWLLDVISALAIAYSARARIASPLPQVTATTAQAAALNNPPTAAPPETPK